MDAKKQIEKLLGKPISPATYYRIKRAMTNSNLPINKENLRVVCAVKVECKKHRIPLEIGLSYYSQMDICENIKGMDLYNTLMFFTNHKPHRTTVMRWFDDGFNPKKFYNRVEISKILLHALIYNLRGLNNVTKQKSNRSCTLPTQKAKY